MSRRKTPQDYHILAEKRGAEWLGPEVANVLVKTNWACSKGHKWEARYNHVRRGTGCPYCADTKKTPSDYYILAELRNFKWLGPEVPNVDTRTWGRCPQGHKWEARYRNVDHGTGCPHCNRGKGGKGRSGIPATNYHILANEHGLKWLGPEVQTVHTKTNWECPKGHQWEARYNTIQQGKAKCLYCFLSEKQSNGEKRVAQNLDALDILYSRQKAFDGCKDKIALRYDFYFSFSGHQFLIEYNGVQHYKPIERWGGEKGLENVQRRDRIKADFAQVNGLHLITIPYTDYDRIGTIIIDRLTEATGENPLTFVDRIGPARGAVGALEGIQLSLGFSGE